jgi:hypothetical protein
MKTEQEQLAECRAHWEATKPDAVFPDYWLGWKAAREIGAASDDSVMTDAEKAKKFDEIQNLMWSWAIHGNLLQSSIAAAVIRQVEIPGPDGEDPDYA